MVILGINVETVILGANKKILTNVQTEDLPNSNIPECMLQLSGHRNSNNMAFCPRQVHISP